MKSSNHNREKHKQDLRKAFSEKDAHGIKAKVGCSTLYTLICAAKKQCALCKVQLDAITQGDHQSRSARRSGAKAHTKASCTARSRASSSRSATR